MIPVRLSISNFMPYRENVPTLDFTGIHTVSICGDNGNGKSAIIDAITWALWGKTRAKRDDELIHQGQYEAAVEFEFTVNAQNYRVIRKHARPKKRGASGQSALNFQIATGNGFRSIDGDTMTQTQQKIIDVLHMDYDTFTNSAYLRQGHADEFTTATPVERKQVLVNILGLSYYDEFEKQAKDIVRQREMIKEQLTLAMAEIDRELQQKADSLTQLEKAQKELARIEDSLKGKEAILKTLRQQKELLGSKREQIAQLDKNIAERSRTLTQWQEQINQLRTRITEHEAVLTKRTEIEDGYKRFVENKGSNDLLNKNLALVNKFNQRCHELEMLIERESQALTKEHALLQSKVAELEKSFGELPRLKEEFQLAQNRLQHLTAEEEILRNRRETSQELAAQIHSMESEKGRFQKEIEEIEEKLSLLLTQPDTAKCPVCQTELGVDGLQHLSLHYNSEKQIKSDSMKNIINSIAKKKAESKIIELEISQIEKNLTKEKAQVQSHFGALEKEISRAEESGRQLVNEKVELKQIEERLAHKDFALVQQEALKQLSIELANINYDPQKHEQARSELENLQKFEVPKQRLEEADRLIIQEKEDMSRSEKAATELQEGLTTDNRKKLELSSEIAALPQVSNDLAQAEIELKQLVAEQKQVQEEIGGIKGRLEYYARRETEKSWKEKQLNLTVKEAAIYHELAEAFGKKGIQALLIETALPEIELKQLVAEQKQVQEEIGGIKGRLEYYARRETEKSGKEKQLNLTVREAAIYHELAEAFGKKGIQALLIETALPEIENEANNLLARMTDNRMHVKIETQKETQRGDVAETLEIKISDELGTRNYEMYSGGEAFRINFAIRIALSRLLARRAGAPLPTLIIDEGFGTQDASGIEKLKEAINSIQDDFEKILVITHVEELRDAFPARIDVLKTAEGSTISLN